MTREETGTTSLQPKRRHEHLWYRRHTLCLLLFRPKRCGYYSQSCLKRAESSVIVCIQCHRYVPVLSAQGLKTALPLLSKQSEGCGEVVIVRTSLKLCEQLVRKFRPPIVTRTAFRLSCALRPQRPNGLTGTGKA